MTLHWTGLLNNSTIQFNVMSLCQCNVINSADQHCMALHCTVYCTALNCVELHGNTLNWITLDWFSTALHCIWHCIELCWIAWHYVELDCLWGSYRSSKLHCTAVHTVLYCTKLWDCIHVTLHWAGWLYIWSALYYVAVHTELYWIVLNCMTIHWTTCRLLLTGSDCTVLIVFDCMAAYYFGLY